jgi:hypothetical protein
MGSGISLTRAQIIEIVKNEIKTEFDLKDSLKSKIRDDGCLAIENFDDEELYYKKIRILDSLLRKYLDE